MNNSKPSALVLLSGGLDSTTCLYLAVAEFGADNVAAIGISYGQRHSVELHCAQQICDRLQIQFNVIAHNAIPDTLLTNEEQEVPDVAYRDIEGVSPMYVPFRNAQMLSIITGHAQARDFDAIYFGAHAEDAFNWAYPDCTPEFIGAMANAIYIGTYHKVRLRTPLMWLMKSDIVQLGSNLEVPFELTWSCYKGEEYQCGKCATCQSRREAFMEAGIDDPTIYSGVQT